MTYDKKGNLLKTFGVGDTVKITYLIDSNRANGYTEAEETAIIKDITPRNLVVRLYNGNADSNPYFAGYTVIPMDQVISVSRPMLECEITDKATLTKPEAEERTFSVKAAYFRRKCGNAPETGLLVDGHLVDLQGKEVKEAYFYASTYEYGSMQIRVPGKLERCVAEPSCAVNTLQKLLQDLKAKYFDAYRTKQPSERIQGLSEAIDLVTETLSSLKERK